MKAALRLPNLDFATQICSLDFEAINLAWRQILHTISPLNLNCGALNQIKFDFTERDGGKFNQDRFKGDILAADTRYALKDAPVKSK